MPVIENDDVIQEFSTKATDHTFNISVLPGRGRRGDDLLDTERSNSSPNLVTVNGIAVP